MASMTRDYSVFEAAMKARIAELNDRVEHIEDELDETPNPKWDENAIEHAEDEVLEELGHSSQPELRAIKAALDRMEAGTYGVCVKCDNDISMERLTVLPHTPFCKECAQNPKA